MRLSFEVHGQSQAELEEQAQRIIEAFTDQTPSYVTITAAPQMSAGDGTVLMWRGEVEAQV